MFENNQVHLKYDDRINFGAFYTPKEYVKIVWEMIRPYMNDNTIILDSSCGYGNFFDINTNCIKKANDIDSIAIEQTKKNFPSIELYNKNALINVNRNMYNIPRENNLIIIGNPPYNDVTSIIRNGVKREISDVDIDLKTRDYGMSFLLSYNKLNADIVCVLHPLSYLIKRSNFALLKKFTKNYKLIDGIIVDSSTFKETLKGNSFPILIALYRKDKEGMDYEYIRNYKFKTIENKLFSLNDFDFITNYINKYPLKNVKPNNNDILFWTMRDINALRRNRTFIKEFGYNTIIINKDKLDYYVYVDVFKEFSYLIPYYFGNLDVFIDDNLFKKYKKYFLVEASHRNEFLKNHFTLEENISLNEARENITQYFKYIMEEHYENKKN